MNKFKSIIIYSIIALLCLAVIAGYVLSDIDRQVITAVPGGNDPAENITTADDADNSDGAKNTDAAEATGDGDNASEAESTGKPEEKATIVNEHVREIMERSASEPDPNPVVGIGRGADYAAVTEEAVNNAGGLRDIIEEGDIVIIKPNICTLAESGTGIITDYRAVQKIVDMVNDLGASRVIVAEGTIAGDAFTSISARKTGYDRIKGAELQNLNYFNKEDCYELKPENSLTGKAIFIPKIYMDADKVINVAKLKTHSIPDAVVSLSLKNALGVPPGMIYGMNSKNGLHYLGIKEAIIDINRIRKPDFAVIEGIVGGEGWGPLINEPVKSEVVFAGRDLVALDSVAINFMGLNADEVPHVKMAAEHNLGISDLNSIKIVGADLDAIKMKFVRKYEVY